MSEKLECGTCRFSARVVTGLMECSFAPDGWHERTRLECRRFPPTTSFWGTSFPTAEAACGEHQSALVRAKEGVE